MSLTIELDDELARALREAARREGIRPDALVADAVRERIEHPAPPGAAREKGLLAALGAGLPEAVWNRYRALCERRRAGTLTPSEQQELIGLTDQVELWYARRV